MFGVKVINFVTVHETFKECVAMDDLSLCCRGTTELQEWVDTINLVAASLSAPPLPSGVGSQARFQRPLMPSSCTKLSIVSYFLFCCILFRIVLRMFSSVSHFFISFNFILLNDHFSYACRTNNFEAMNTT
jgi:hypothetical protein